MYDALEGVFPLQNGEVKEARSSAADSVQVVDETRAAEEPASTTSSGQQGEAESHPPAADGDDAVEPHSVSTTPLEDSSNGPTVTVEI